MALSHRNEQIKIIPNLVCTYVQAYQLWLISIFSWPLRLSPNLNTLNNNNKIIIFIYFDLTRGVSFSPVLWIWELRENLVVFVKRLRVQLLWHAQLMVSWRTVSNLNLFWGIKYTQIKIQTAGVYRRRGAGAYNIFYQNWSDRCCTSR